MRRFPPIVLEFVTRLSTRPEERGALVPWLDLGFFVSYADLAEAFFWPLETVRIAWMGIVCSVYDGSSALSKMRITYFLRGAQHRREAKAGF